ncbi:hypothetical protein PENTCL1PPCAC_7618, partial [Pristionchus entomophagus]
DSKNINSVHNSILSWSAGQHVIELKADGGYAQIRFNPLHRAPLRLSPNGENGLSKPEDVFAFYQAYQVGRMLIFMRELSSVREGKLLIFDNLRVLHSRTAFSGHRRMSGCYLSGDGFMARARLH